MRLEHKMNFKNIFFFFTYVLFNPRLIILAFHKIYIPVFVQYEWLKKYDIKTIIAAGAYHGHVSKSLHYIFPDAKIYMFEPIKQNYEILTNTLRSKNIIPNKLALINKVGQSTFYINNYTPDSSILELKEEYQKNFPQLAKIRKVKVKTTTLDSYFKNKHVDKRVFLKIDTQGAERLILDGGRQFLKNVSIIHIETFFDPMYKNQGLFQDVYDILTSLGFKYAGEAREAQFYPLFETSPIINSIFINTNIE